MLIALSLCFCVSVNASAAADTQQIQLALPSPLAQLLAQLPKSSFKEKAVIVAELEAAGKQQALPALKALLAGKLYYSKADSQQVLGVSELADEGYTLTDLLSAQTVTTVTKTELKKHYKKVRTNNKLRKLLRTTIARSALSYGDKESRMDALNAMLANLDATSVALIRELRDRETSSNVQQLMDVALAIHTLGSSADHTQLLAAVNTLKGRLELPVKAALNELVERYADEISYRLVVKAAQKSLKSIEQKTGFFNFVEKLFFGLSLGSVLLLAAIGLAITFGVMGVINMAHGEMIMLGAYTTYVVQLVMPNFIDYSLWVAIPAAFMVSGLVGIAIQRLVIRHLNGRPLETLLATFGISLILQQAVRSIFSPLNRQVSSPEWMSGALELNPVLSLTYNRLYILAFSLLVFVALILIIKKTSLGLNVRAVSQNRAMAKAMGVRTEWVDAMTFGLGSGVAGVAGVALSQLTNVGPNLGQAYIIDSFMVVVFGGVGNLLGTLVGAFSLGVANKFMEPVTGAVLANILVLVFIILFIQKRPKGLFPQKGRAAE